MTKRYSLHGFAGGSARGPHFIEPVFSNGRELFVQVASAENDLVSDFKKFNDNVDFFEHLSDETSTIGERCTYGVIDDGRRLIYGDKDYVSRYISQNIRRYIDNPYFLTECVAFTGDVFPELEFIETNQDLLELSVVVNSLKEFAKSAAWESDGLNVWNPKITSFEAENSPSTELVDHQKTVIGAWHTYAAKRNRKLAKSPRWSDLEASFLRIYDDDVVLANRSLAAHYSACFHALRDGGVDFSVDDGQSVSHYQFKKYSKKVQNKNSINLRAAYAKNAIHVNADDKAVQNSLKLINKSLRDKRVSRGSIALQFYFFGVMMKITIDLLMDRKK
ncbi:hypothetical protein HFO55_01475 [Rhizobium leguminosarum]|uniref:hypothetical protein n=1 Tax=Rhizobium leguminosarum TaxID=384 RepID=UPI001C98A36E|nr:hypothetical protein [Rhizobium leguminosarum]MBY5565932.1 hypothetical protein [Rhizobium leguminosarum]MBY5573088.1 hypothetical protein [Rhizobium leguminosarum]